MKNMHVLPRFSLSKTIGLLLLTSVSLLSSPIFAANEAPSVLPSSAAQNRPSVFSTAAVAARPTLTPLPPALTAKSYILIDADSGKIIVAQNADTHLPPASLTKMMTSYLASEAIRSGRLHLTDLVPVSEAAWRTGGSKMFIKVGESVSVQDILQGIIVDSGNDACVAIAEHLAGGEDAFANLMNQQATLLGMNNTHFMDANGLPNPQHYSSAKDMAILARAIIQHFPEDYKWYSQKWFSYRNIKQPNRNRLLWSDPTVDGLKTGHTDEAGYCLVASAVRNGMRIISVVMGEPSDNARAQDSSKLLNYGFRFFETHKLYAAGNEIGKARIWMGRNQFVAVGLSQDFYLTNPNGQYRNLQPRIILQPAIKAPITKGQSLGNLEIVLNGSVIASQPLVALQDNPRGGVFARMSDYIRLGLRKVLGSGEATT